MLELLSHLPGVSESSDSDENLENIALVSVEEAPVNANEMDETGYLARSRQLTDSQRTVEDALSDFTVDDVIEITEEDTYSEPLNEIKTKFEAFRTQVRNFYSEFDRVQHAAWEQEWEEKIRNLQERYKQNEREVKKKVKDLKDQEKAELKAKAQEEKDIQNEKTPGVSSRK